MAQITYRANLSAKSFPFLSQNWGRTVIVPQYDNTFSRQLASTEDVDKDVGIPQVFYCHNVMPFQQGFQSIGYEKLFNATSTFYNFVSIHLEDVGTNLYYAITATGDFYVYRMDAWRFLQSFPAGSKITTAKRYIYVSGVGCFVYDSFYFTLTPQVLTGLVPTNIQGILSIAGYLVAWDLLTIYWSSTIDETDFVPSLVTGAGSGTPETAKGNIVYCAVQQFGFIVYTASNAIAGVYSGNSRFPFNFREIVNSGGSSDQFQLTYDANTGNHYVYTTSGVQLVSNSQSQTVLPEATDFLGGQILEDYDESTDTFIVSAANAHMKTRLSMIASRYLVISYGITSLTHAIVYDLTTKRWGKLKIPHVQVIEYFVAGTSNTETPKKSIGFFAADGSLNVVSFDVNANNSSGVIALGKYQFVRQRLLQLDEINIENVQPGTTPVLYLLPALDGKNTVKEYPVLLTNNGMYRKYACRCIGTNVSVVLKGAFSLESLVLVFNIHGKR